MYHIVSSCISKGTNIHKVYNFWLSGHTISEVPVEKQFLTNPSKGARQTHFLQPMRSHDPKTIPLQDHKGANTVSINRAGTLALWHEERSMVDKAQCIHLITTLQSPQRSKHPASSCKYMQILTTPMPDVACELNRSFMQIYADLWMNSGIGSVPNPRPLLVARDCVAAYAGRACRPAKPGWLIWLSPCPWLAAWSMILHVVSECPAHKFYRHILAL